MKYSNILSILMIVFVMGYLGPLQGSDYVDALEAEVEKGGASIDSSSTQNTRQQFEAGLQRHSPKTFAIYQDLPEDKQIQAWREYQNTFSFPGAGKMVVHLRLQEAQQGKESYSKAASQ